MSALPKRILIVSSHPLFGQGLRRLLQERSGTGSMVIDLVSSVPEALDVLESQPADLVIVDYDDEKVNREEFLRRFVKGEQQIRLVLFSLSETGGQAIVYDRRTMAASQIDEWMRSLEDL